MGEATPTPSSKDGQPLLGQRSTRGESGRSPSYNPGVSSILPTKKKLPSLGTLPTSGEAKGILGAPLVELLNLL